MGEKRAEDIEELRMVLGAITDFVRDIKEPLQDLLKTLVGALSGEQLGREVAAFYSELARSGLPEDMAREMTREFFQRKLEAAPSVERLLESFSRFKGPMAFAKTGDEGGWRGGGQGSEQPQTRGSGEEGEAGENAGPA